MLVRVQPRAGRDAILGWRGDVLRVSVSAPPVDGEANRATGLLLARALGVPASAVSIVRGDRGRDKLVRVAGLSAADVATKLGGLGGPPKPPEAQTAPAQPWRSSIPPKPPRSGRPGAAVAPLDPPKQ